MPQGVTIFTLLKEPPSLLQQIKLNIRKNLQFAARIYRHLVILGVRKPQVAMIIGLIVFVLPTTFFAGKLYLLHSSAVLGAQDLEQSDLAISEYIDPATLDQPKDIQGLANIVTKGETNVGSGGPEVAPDPQIKQHMVKPGETLSEIANAYGFSSTELYATNNSQLSTGKDDIYPGQILVIPGTDLTSDQIKAAEDSLKKSSAASNSKINKQPFISPIPAGYIVSQGFIPGVHTGHDYASSWGNRVVAVRDGRVISATYGWDGGYGNLVVIDNGNGTTFRYAHLSSIDPTIYSGVYVQQGDKIGKVGSTGNSTGPHLHLELRRGSTPIDY